MLELQTCDSIESIRSGCTGVLLPSSGHNVNLHVTIILSKLQLTSLRHLLIHLLINLSVRLLFYPRAI